MLVQQLMNKIHVIFETSDHNRTLAPGGALARAQREQCSYLTLKEILGATASNSRRARSRSAIAFILRPPCLAVECWLGLWKEGLSCLSSRCRASSSPFHSKAALLASVQHHVNCIYYIALERLTAFLTIFFSHLCMHHYEGRQACTSAGNGGNGRHLCTRPLRSRAPAQSNVAVALPRFWSRGDPWARSGVVPNKLYTASAPAALGSDMCMMSVTEEESFFICDCSRSTTRSAFIRAMMLLTLALSAGFLARLVGIPCASAHFMSFCCFMKAPRRGCAFRGPFTKQAKPA